MLKNKELSPFEHGAIWLVDFPVDHRDCTEQVFFLGWWLWSKVPLNFATIPRHSFFVHQEIFSEFLQQTWGFWFAREIGAKVVWLWLNTSKHNFCLWDEHPFTNYFDVHRGGVDRWVLARPPFCFGGEAASIPSKKVPWNNRCNRARPNLVGDRSHWIFNFH